MCGIIHLTKYSSDEFVFEKSKKYVFLRFQIHPNDSTKRRKSMVSAHIDENGKSQTVKEHCANVAKYAAENGRVLGMENVMKLAGVLHDIGKNTKVFGEYIESSHNGESKFKRGEINHSSAGARYLMNLQSDNTLYAKLTKQLIAYAVFSHHGLNDCLTYEGEDKFTQRINPAKEIYYNEAIANSEQLFYDCDIIKMFSNAQEEIKPVMDKITAVKKAMAKDGNGKEEQFFLIGCLQRLILSMLIDADRRDTAEFMSGRFICRISDDERKEFYQRCLLLLEEKLNSFECENRIDGQRREMSEQCESFAKNNTNGIYKLSIPTGGGKTYASMRYALNLAIKIQKQHIIYIAPYLSILEQNAADIKKVFDDNERILEHHSNVFFSDDSPENINNYEILADDWSSPIILTTMVRFLNVLFGKSNSDIRRMHQLKSSVIIIDEAQSIPVKYTHLFNTMINFLGMVCDSTIVMCTATQPLFELTKRPLLYSENSDIVSNIEKYSAEFKRANILTDYAMEKSDTQRLSDIIMNVTDNNCLVILNTKSAVQKLYDSLKNNFTLDFELIQLTTYMCAQHRLDIIHDLKRKLEEKKKLICISTQLIEAGVDISFETVVRSLSGLDSIVQAAGRCNRNGENSRLGNTYIVQYTEENVSSLEDIKKAQEAMQTVLYKSHDDLLMPKAIAMYYKQYFFDRGSEMDFPLTKLNSQLSMYSLLAMNEIGVREYKKFNRKPYSYYIPQAFKTASLHFNPIDDNGSVGIIVYYGESKEFIEKLRKTSDFDVQRSILKKLQRYTVNISQSSALFRKISELHAFEDSLFEGSLLILSESYYDENGISSELSSLIF